jgi:hypothetical protein
VDAGRNHTDLSSRQSSASKIRAPIRSLSLTFKK